jgi:hypothetical protein
VSEPTDTTPRPTARELVRGPIDMARQRIGSIKAHDQVASGVVEVIEALCTGLERLADVVDGKQGPIVGVCRKCGCTNEHGCNLDNSGRSCWWADGTKTLCSRCV